MTLIDEAISSLIWIFDPLKLIFFLNETVNVSWGWALGVIGNVTGNDAWVSI